MLTVDRLRFEQDSFDYIVDREIVIIEKRRSVFERRKENGHWRKIKKFLMCITRMIFPIFIVEIRVYCNSYISFSALKASLFEQPIVYSDPPLVYRARVSQRNRRDPD